MVCIKYWIGVRATVVSFVKTKGITLPRELCNWTHGWKIISVCRDAGWLWPCDALNTRGGEERPLQARGHYMSIHTLQFSVIYYLQSLLFKTFSILFFYGWSGFEHCSNYPGEPCQWISDDYSSYFLKHVLTESLDILNTKYDEDKFMNEWIGQRFI